MLAGSSRADRLRRPSLPAPRLLALPSNKEPRPLALDPAYIRGARTLAGSSRANRVVRHCRRPDARRQRLSRRESVGITHAAAMSSPAARAGNKNARGQESRQPCRQPLPGHVGVAAPRARTLTGITCADRVLRHWRGREHGRSSAAVAPAASSVPAGARLRRRSESADAPRQPRRPQLTALIIVAPGRAPVAGGPVGAPGRCRRCRRLRCGRRACTLPFRALHFHASENDQPVTSHNDPAGSRSLFGPTNFWPK